MIYVDSREKDTIINLIPDAKILLLESADFAFLGRGIDDKPHTVGIERKKLPDFLSSLNSNRLARQLSDMADSYQTKYLVIEGVWRRNASGLVEVVQNGGFEPLVIARRYLYYAAMINFVDTQAVCSGVITYWTQSMQETATLIHTLYSHWRAKPLSSRTSHVNINDGLVTVAKLSVTEKMLAAIPAVGLVKARELAKHFTTPAEFLSASIDDWKSFPGIGDKTAEKIMEALHGKR